MGDLLHDLVLPETDRGAVTQWVVAALVFAAAMIAVRRHRAEYRLFVLGLAVCTFAWFGLRAVH